MIILLLTVLYVTAAFTLTIYASSQLILLILYWRHRRAPALAPPTTVFPCVVVQLPVYNEPHVIARLIDAAARLDYPADRLTIQILDDSNDATTQIASGKVSEWSARGVHIEHIRRDNRVGYKAGALAYGLTLTDADFAAVFDADFTPQSDFLRAMIPTLLEDETVACVQARWGHMNPFENALTLMQTIALDGHFVVEQIARAQAGLFANFNGSGGIWRIAAVTAAGGWRDVTLTEDLDLSYRVQLNGGRIAYRPDVIVAAELPATMPAYKQQQARWARGGTQVMRLLLPTVLRARVSPLRKFMAAMHPKIYGGDAPVSISGTSDHDFARAAHTAAAADRGAARFAIERARRVRHCATDFIRPQSARAVSRLGAPFAWAARAGRARHGVIMEQYARRTARLDQRAR